MSGASSFTLTCRQSLITARAKLNQFVNGISGCINVRQTSNKLINGYCYAVRLRRKL